MKIVLLGTGDAVGTPRVGCSCPQCSHARQTGRERLRTSLLVSESGHNILVDTGPDLRRQLLENGSPRIDAVLWTHGHYDHFMGFGEFYRVQKMPTVFAPPPVMDYCGKIFSFLDFPPVRVGEYEPFVIHGIEWTFLPVCHPPAYTCGLLISAGDVRIGYTSDTNRNIPDRTREALTGVDLLLVDALLPGRLHVPKHMNYEEACELAEDLHAADFRCVHLSHLVPWDLPHLGRDGEEFVF
ncbi:MAG: MBL fold metallo-hydrolase [Methanolinea sp.]|jgi:phosphoribosyl 1,2-cyclic phosphate phosphodiesterase|nr:MBL fold metallo-hydrolase [Methanolinea sp.]HQI13738.1 MBL fold metallo-hydrolase [Methanolinea sp.]